jgi:PPOX class probable F420-dependent enzyme
MVLDTPLDAQMMRALHDAQYMYVTTYSRAGKPGTVPTWLWPRDGHVYFTTKRDSLKARRIRDGGRVTVHVGA